MYGYSVVNLENHEIGHKDDEIIISVKVPEGCCWAGVPMAFSKEDAVLIAKEILKICEG
ncbi:hypothetical protein AVV36_gp111 [Pectobacterium bacteriophage PM2]|uniref:Uncharacterized protein n=1 Tax=Pectobacterium bacteriophage PM2 TaxID=1429794 RepID=A0A0A0Q0M7_9CAUD|nr:hypothetical protein AVV36_gp111 [Pectobacterium bacteriophage PM2]AHY25073.1 hypothetical protein PM2_111 [Pectobacterium bacteriophage PM2]